MAQDQVRVAHVLGRLSATGGIQVVVRRIAHHLDPAKVTLDVVTARPSFAEDRHDELPATVHGLGYTRKHTPLSRLRTSWHVARKLRKLAPHVVHLHSGTVLLGLIPLLTLRRPAFLVEVHDAPGSGRHSRGTDRFEGAISRMFGATVICHSTSVEREVALRWRIPSRRLVRFPLSVDTALFQPVSEATRLEWRAAHGIDAHELVLVAVGRIVPSKRFDLLVDALARLRTAGVPARLVIVGRGREADSLKALAETLGVANSVLVLSDVAPGQPLVDVLGACDVLCSASEYEGFGLTIVEGMAVGLPVVATAVGGVPDLVDEGVTGLLVPPGDLDGFVERLTKLAQDPARRSALGQAGRDRAVDHYRVRAMVAAFESLYQRLA